MNRQFGMLLVIAALLLPNVAGAGVGNKVVRETAELLMRRGGKEVAEETVETLAKKMSALAARHGDDLVTAAFTKVGPRAGRIAGEAGEESAGAVLRLLSRHGDDAMRVASRPKALRLLAKLGDDVAEPLIRHGEIGETLIKEAIRSRRQGRGTRGELSQQNVRRLAMLVQDQGEKVTPGLVKLFAKLGHADTLADYLWRNKGTIFFGAALATFVSSPEPFLNAAETVTTKTLDSAETVATETLHSAVTPIVSEAASQFPWGVTIVIGLLVGGAVVVERIGTAKVIKSGLAMAAAKLKEFRIKPNFSQITPKPKRSRTIMTRKFGEQNYDLGQFMQRGVHEIANSLYPESNIPLRDHAGLYGSRENEYSQADRDVEADGA